MNQDLSQIDFDVIFVRFMEHLTSPELYIQACLILLAVVFAYTLTYIFKKYSPLFREPDVNKPLYKLRKELFAAADLVFPLLSIVALKLTLDLSGLLTPESWLIRIAISLTIIIFLYIFIARFIKKRLVKSFIKWIIIPIVVLYVFGWLGIVTDYLNSIYVQIGNIKISAFGLARLLVFGAIIFWLGRVSNSVGQQLIRNQEELDLGTREVFAKLFEVTVFVAVFIFMLQLLGVNLTALAVFGGALGVGLGFGLQSIASNFISGIIILLDRSITVGDYIELEDGRGGTIRQLNMRSAILETYDGKDIMVPNEQFINTNFVNWTHKNQKQRYPINFSVAYDTDLDLLFDVVREAVASHPKVLSGDELPIEERPDAEIAGFGESGIDILVEFWMEGVDDGKNRVGADVLYLIWKALKQHDIEIPYPRRDVTILNPDNK